MNKVTPGLWEVHNVRKIGVGRVGRRFNIYHPLITEDGEYKGQCGGYHTVIAENVDLTEANAYFIAAAHDLFDVVAWLVAEVDAGTNIGVLPDGLFNAARVALDKAERKGE